MTWKPIDYYSLNTIQLMAFDQLWKRRKFEYFLHPGQAKIYKEVTEKQQKTVVLNLARQFGKSTLCVWLAIEKALSTPGSLVIYGAPTKEMAESLLRPKLDEIFLSAPKEYVPTRNNNIWTFKNKARIIALGVNQQGGNKWRGQAVDLVVLDECRDMPRLDNFISAVVTPTFTTRADARLILASTPPDSPDHSFTSKYIREAIMGGYYYHGTYLENPMVTKDQLERINSMKENEQDAYKREYLADYTQVDQNKKVIKNFNRKENEEWFLDWEHGKYPMRPYVSIDPGARDKTAILFGLYDAWNNTLVIIDEIICNNNPTTKDIANLTKQKENQLYKLYNVGDMKPIRTIDIDLRLIRDLKDTYDFECTAVRKSMHGTMLNRLQIHLEEKKIRIHPNCKQLLFQIDTGIWNEKKTDYVRTDKSGHLDAIDALKYMNLVCKWDEVFINKKEEVVDGRIRYVNMMPKKQHTDLASQLLGR